MTARLRATPPVFARSHHLCACMYCISYFAVQKRHKNTLHNKQQYCSAHQHTQGHRKGLSCLHAHSYTSCTTTCTVYIMPWQRST